MPHELSKSKKKIIILQCCLLFSQQWTISQVVTCNFIQRAMTSSVAEPRRNSKHFPKPNLHPKNAIATVWRSAARLIHYSLLSPGETIASENCAQQIHEMHRKLPWLQPASVQRRGPILFHDSAQPHGTRPVLQKLNKMLYKALSHLPYSPDLSPTDYHFFKHFNNFSQGKHLHNQQEAEKAFQELLTSQSTDFTRQE